MMIMEFRGVVRVSVVASLVITGLALLIVLLVIFLYIKPNYESQINDLQAKLKTTIYDVNIQNASVKEVDDMQMNYMRNTLLVRIQSLEAKLNISNS